MYMCVLDPWLCGVLQDAFWALVALIGSEKFAMHGLLIPGLPKLLAYHDYHAAMRKRILPKLHKHLVHI